MFTRLLVGLDGSASADAALAQALVLAARFQARLVIAHVAEARDADGGMLERAREQAAAAGVTADAVLRRGNPDTELADLARETDAALVGRRGTARESGAELGETVASLITIAECCVIVCGTKPSPMRACAIAYDGGETSKRALGLAIRFAGIVGSTVHLIHASADRAAGLRVVGEAEAMLSLDGVVFATHIERGTPGQAVARVVARTGCDALFAGAHVAQGRSSKVTVSHAAEILLHTDIPVVIQP